MEGLRPGTVEVISPWKREDMNGTGSPSHGSTYGVATTEGPEIQRDTCCVHAYDWTVEDAASDEGHVVVRAWCLNRDSEPVLVRIEDFPAYCFVELPMYVNMNLYTWNETRASRFFSVLQEKLGNRKATRGIFKMLKKIYYYRGGRTFPMLMLTFNTLEAMNHCVRVLNDVIKTEEWGVVKCNVWESEISIHRKLLTIRKIRYGQWFTFNGFKVPEDQRISTVVNEYIVGYADLEPVPLTDTMEWITHPRMLAFDIECYSSNHRGFPDKYNALHDAFMISCIYQRLGHPETRKRYGIIYGDCEDIPREKLENLEIFRVGSEEAMVEKLGELVMELDPEIFAGYNISFDIGYLDARLKRFMLKWPVMGRLIGRRSFTTSSSWRSGAYGHNSVILLRMEGRINMDLYSIVRRGQRRLDMYNLDTVAKVFLGRGKHDVKAITMFQVYEGMKGTLEALYTYLQSHDDISLTLDGAREFLSTRCIGHSLWSNLEITNIEELRRLRDDHAYWRRRMREVMEYCIRDSELVIDLAEELNVWIGHVEMSSIVGTTIVDLYTRGQQIRCHSLLYNLAANEGYVLDKRVTSGFKFSGGHVEEPIIGIHDNIVCLDFASLYPSIIQAFNICFTTLIPPPNEVANDIPDEDCHVVEFDQEEPLNQPEQETRVATEDGDSPDEEDILEETGGPARTVTRHYSFRFYKKTLGLLPRLVRDLVAERRLTIRQRDEAKRNGQTMTVLILEERQLALKVTANSFFGFLGIRNGGKMPLLEGAMSITAKGRELLGAVKKHLADKYGARVVYGDSVRAGTPILVRQDGRDETIRYLPISELYDLGRVGFEGISDITIRSSLTGKEYASLPNFEVWSDLGWTPIRHIMRHHTTKRLYRVLTHTGLVDVTEDHSLLDSQGREVSIGQSGVGVGSSLLHCPPVAPSNRTNLAFHEEKEWPFSFEQQVEASEKYRRLVLEGCSARLKIRDGMIIVRESRVPWDSRDEKVQVLEDLGTSTEYVYDLETENHHFGAGVGCLVVHNTDSVMVDLGLKDSKLCNYWGVRLSEEISGKPERKDEKTGEIIPAVPGLFHDSRLQMAFEKAMRIINIAKKKYAALFIAKDGTFKTKPIKDESGKEIGQELDILRKGLVVARRDNCRWVYDTYNTILDLALRRRPFEEAMDVLIDAVDSLLKGRVPYKNLVIVRGLGENYKNNNYFLKVFADNLNKEGKEVRAGDRLPFLVVKVPGDNGKLLLGHRMRLLDSWLEKPEEEREPIDYNYYLEHMLQNHITQLLNVGYSETIAKLPNIGVKPSNRHKFIGISDTVKLLVTIHKLGIDILPLKEAIRANLRNVEQMERDLKERNAKLQMIIDESPVPPSTPSPVPSPRLTTQPILVIEDIPSTPSALTTIASQPLVPLSSQPLVPSCRPPPPTFSTYTGRMPTPPSSIGPNRLA